MHGEGKMTYPNSDSYTGIFMYGKKHGEGVFSTNGFSTK